MLHRVSIFLSAVIASASGIAEAQSPLPTPYAPTAGRPTVGSSLQNPANAAMLPDSTTEFGLSAFDTNTVTMHYRESDPVVKRKAWTPNPLTVNGGTVYRLGPLGVGVVGVVPPLTLRLPRITDIPIVVQGDPNNVDVEATVRVKGIAGFLGAVRIGSLALGAQVLYGAIGLDVDAFESSTGLPLLSVGADAELIDSMVGARANLGPLSVAVQTNVVSKATVKPRLESPLLKEAASIAGGSDDGSLPTQTRTSSPGSRIVLGLGLKFSPTFRLYADLFYQRADPNAEEISPVELRVKPKDTYDTLGVAAGVDVGAGPNRHLYLRGQYQPPYVGPGGRGPDSKTGYGTMETVQVFLGVQNLTPYKAVESGVRLDLPQTRFFKRGEISVGARYLTASLGVDEEGELPAAYTQTRVSFPLSVAFRQ